MQQLKELSKGLETLQPFLSGYGFEFENYDIKKGSDGYFTFASFTNGHKKLSIDYRFSIGQVLYQFDNSIVSHPFYLDQLGLADKTQHKGFLLINNQEEFKYILDDFEFLVDDFFKGECINLVEFSKLQDKIITELDRKIRIENSIKFDNIRIEKARQLFRNKEYKKCFAIYSFVDNKNLFEEIDTKVIEFCNRHI